jgi:ABC-2 type transport system ATP-binding protein
MHALSIRGLRKTYDNGFEAVKGIDLDVPRGEFFALLGPNGAGKSTTIGIVSSLVNKTAGTVSVFGHDLDREPAAVKAAIGLVPQEFNFNQFEPVEEIVINQAGYYGIPRREAKVRAEQALKQLDLWDRRRTEARQLSGGLKRRLMIARALAHRPGLLILDEPTAGVDIEIRHSMWDFLKRINAEGTSIILTTHYLEEAENLCRQIAIIDHGRIVEQAHMAELLRRLDTETFVLTLEQPCASVPDVPGYAMTLRDDGNLEVCVAQQRGINDLFAALTAQGLQVTSLRNKQNRLEQLFIDLVQAGRMPEQDLPVHGDAMEGEA